MADGFKRSMERGGRGEGGGTGGRGEEEGERERGRVKRSGEVYVVERF